MRGAESSQSDTLWCVTHTDSCALRPTVCCCHALSCPGGCINSLTERARGTVHPSHCTSLSERAHACVRYCVSTDDFNWIMLRNAGCVGFRKSPDCILLSHDISVMISVRRAAFPTDAKLQGDHKRGKGAGPEGGADLKWKKKGLFISKTSNCYLHVKHKWPLSHQ